MLYLETEYSEQKGRGRGGGTALDSPCILSPVATLAATAEGPGTPGISGPSGSGEDNNATTTRVRLRAKDKRPRIMTYCDGAGVAMRAYTGFLPTTRLLEAYLPMRNMISPTIH